MSEPPKIHPQSARAWASARKALALIRDAARGDLAAWEKAEEQLYDAAWEVRKAERAARIRNG